MKYIIHKILKENIKGSISNKLLKLTTILFPPHSVFEDWYTDATENGLVDVQIEYSIDPKTTFSENTSSYDVKYSGTIFVLIHDIRTKSIVDDSWDIGLKKDDVPNFIWDDLSEKIIRRIREQVSVILDYEFIFPKTIKITESVNNDNTPKQSNFDKLIDKFKENFPEELKDKVDVINDFVKNYIKDNNFTIKFLNSCTTGFAGVRTKDQIIICSPMNMGTIGDFIYTIFHEIRHEEQMTNLKLENPLTGDLEDFEELSRKYWDLELDADRFAKEMIAKLVIKLNIPIDVAKTQFTLSPYIQSYPSLGKMIKHHLQGIIDSIKAIKKSGGEYNDIQDHPMVKNHIDKLEDFI